jgi:hypothetical protein
MEKVIRRNTYNTAYCSAVSTITTTTKLPACPPTYILQQPMVPKTVEKFTAFYGT